MRLLLKAILAFCIVFVAILLLALEFTHVGKSDHQGVSSAVVSNTGELPTPIAQPSASSDGTTISSAEIPSPLYADGYDPRSTEIIGPYEISRNPYKWKGHSGILDTIRTPLIVPNGDAQTMFVPISSLKFDRMIDEHTATYDLMVVKGELMEDGQIAVILPDSNPPNASRLWRVLVDGPVEGTNVFGGTINVTAVRFEGYYSPPPTPAPASPGPVSPPEQTSENQATSSASEQAANPMLIAGNSPSGPQASGTQGRYSAYVAQLQSVVASRGFQSIGKPWLVDSDAQGNKLLVQQAICNNADAHCQKLFIALNDRFLGTDTSRPSWGVHTVRQERLGSFSAVYDDLSGTSRTLFPVKVIYTWDGQRLIASGTPPTR